MGFLLLSSVWEECEDKSSMSPGQTLAESTNVTIVKKREKDYREKIKENYDRRHQVVAPEELSADDKV